MSDLKTCPFCGSKAILVHDNNGYCVACCNRKCDVFPVTWYFKTVREAIEAWNRRAGDSNDEMGS